MQLVIHVLTEVADIAMPFGFSFGTMIIFIWTIPMLPRLFKSIF